MTAGLRFFYRHIHVTGFENIPSKGPVIIIANHNASLMDAALLGILLKRKAYFFARGDVFINKPIQKMLWWLHMMPVHSHEGGRNSLGVNTESFSDGRQILLHGGMVVFFPESASHIEHQLLPFRKGVFRLAFDTAAAGNFSFDIPIVPIGITYDHPVDCRTEVQVHAGRPLLLSAYTNQYRQNAPVALLRISKDAHRAIHKLVLDIKDKSRLQTTSQYLIVSRNDKKNNCRPWMIESAQKLVLEQNICTVINSAPEKNFENKKQQADAYFALLSGAGLKDKTISGSYPYSIWKRIKLLYGFPFYLTGLLLNGLPVLIARQVADKKVYRRDFYSWIFVVCYSFGYFFWLAAVLIICFLFEWQYALGFLVLMIASGIFAYIYKDWLHDSRQQRKWQLLPVAAKTELLAMRKTIQQAL